MAWARPTPRVEPISVPVVIVDDDTAVISVEPASANEGDTLRFTVSSHIPTTHNIDVTYSTVELVTGPTDERATGGACVPKVTGDYAEATDLTVTIVADNTAGTFGNIRGGPTATIDLDTCNDGEDEDPERFLVELSDPVYANADTDDKPNLSVRGASAIGTIADGCFLPADAAAWDPSWPRLSIFLGPGTVREPEIGTVNAVFTVRVDRPFCDEHNFKAVARGVWAAEPLPTHATPGSDSTPGRDFEQFNSEVKIPQGVTEILVPVTIYSDSPDAVEEPDELLVFTVAWQIDGDGDPLGRGDPSPDVTFRGGASRSLTIYDGVVEVSIHGAEAVEGDRLEFRASIDRVSSSPVVVRVAPSFSAEPGAAEPGAADRDDVSSSGYFDLRIDPGDLSSETRGPWATFDNLREGSETFELNIGNTFYPDRYYAGLGLRQGPTRGRETAVGTIHDADCIHVADREEGDATGEVSLWARTNVEEDWRRVSEDAGDVMRLIEDSGRWSRVRGALQRADMPS